MICFSEFINESFNDDAASKIAKAVLAIAIENSGKPGKVIKRISYAKPIPFNLVIKVNRSTDFMKSLSKEFSEMPWEIFNFDDRGFAVDATTVIVGNSEPRLEVTLTINPTKEPAVHKDLYFILLQAIRHEIDHMLKGHETSIEKNDREDSQDSYKYFLLPDEMGPMIDGLTLMANQKGTMPRDEFARYLTPFVKSGFISPAEFKKIMHTWLNFTRVQESTVLKYSEFALEKKINPAYLTKDAPKMRSEIKKNAKKDDDDPTAYVSDPKGGWKADYSKSGKRYKTKPSKYTVAYNKKFKGK